jgi:outer membrane protein OmpA-like peptidoglycan-associated protein
VGGVVHYAPEARPTSPPPRHAAVLVAAAAISVAACSPTVAPIHARASNEPSPAPLVAPPTSAPSAAAPAGGVDTDQDGLPDAEDACPTLAGSASAEQAKKGCRRIVKVEVVNQGLVILEYIQFTYGEHAIDARSRAIIENIAKVLHDHPDITKVAVEGHASLNEPNAMKLSEARAQEVVEALVALKVEPARLVAKPHGGKQPIADNATREGRVRNRRVEFRILSESCPLPVKGAGTGSSGG